MSEDPEQPYEVGYKKPPKETRFKKGKSGNPKGRRPRVDTVEGILREKLQQKVPLPHGGTTRVIELIVARGVQDLAAGNPRRWTHTFEYLERFNPKAKFVPTSDDEARLNELIAEMSKNSSDDE